MYRQRINGSTFSWNSFSNFDLNVLQQFFKFQPSKKCLFFLRKSILQEEQTKKRKFPPGENSQLYDEQNETTYVYVHEKLKASDLLRFIFCRFEKIACKVFLLSFLSILFFTTYWSQTSLILNSQSIYHASAGTIHKYWTSEGSWHYYITYKPVCHDTRDAQVARNRMTAWVG